MALKLNKMEAVEGIVKIGEKGQIMLPQKIREKEGRKEGRNEGMKEGRAENSGFNEKREERKWMLTR